MSNVISLKRVTFEDELLMASKKSCMPQIQPLLSTKIEQPETLIFDIMKYKFSKPYCPPDQPIKTESQNEKKVKSDIVSNEEVAAELGPDYNPLCSQLT